MNNDSPSTLKSARHAILFVFYCVCLLAAAEAALRFIYRDGRINYIEQKPSMPISQCTVYPAGVELGSPLLYGNGGKSAKPFTIFVFGESSVQGYPFNDRSNFSKWMNAYLADIYPGRPIRVVKCGMTSATTVEWSSLFFDSFRYRPDMMVIYAGHNNFVAPTLAPKLPRWSPARRWLNELYIPRLMKLAMLRGVSQRYHPAMNDLVIEKTCRVFISHVQEMLRESERRGIPVVVSTIESNKGGWGPGSTDPGLLCMRRQTTDIYIALCRAKELFDNGEYGRALEALKPFDAENNHNEPYPFIAYYRGLCLEKLGNAAGATKSFNNALRYNIYRHRAPAELNGYIKSLKDNSKKIFIADSAAALAERSKTGVPGNDLFVDHVHPGIAGQEIIAMAIVRAIAKSGTIKGSADWKRIKTEAEYREQLGIPANETDLMDLSFCFRLMQQKKFPLSLACYKKLSTGRPRFTEEAPVPVLELLLIKDADARRSFAAFVKKRGAKAYSDDEIEKAFGRLKKSVFAKKDLFIRDLPPELNAYPAPDFKAYMERSTGLKFR